MAAIEFLPDRPTKPWHRSRILWANIVAALLAIIEAKYGLVMDQLGPTVYLLATLALTTINIILRYDTDRAIE